MKKTRLALVSLAVVALAAGSAFAEKTPSPKEFSLVDLPALQALADVNETEPNDTCPGEAYTYNDVFHGEITAGDEDWITFSANAGDLITIGTDTDGGPDVDTYIELWDNTCSTLLTDDDDSGGTFRYSLISGFPAPYTGAYNLKIRGYSATTSVGTYICIGNAVTPTGLEGFCPVGTYKAVKRNVNLDIPDNDPGNPLHCPVIEFADVPGLVITDVIVDLNIEHTWTGDLIITLCHTPEGGGAPTCVDLVNNAGGPGFGCSGDLVSDPEDKYYFSSRPDLDLLGDPDCPSVLDPLCYRSLGDLSVFNGLPLGDGTWELILSDNAAGDLGFVYNWSVHLLAEAPISVEASSWGAIKSSYR